MKRHEIIREIASDIVNRGLTLRNKECVRYREILDRDYIKDNFPATRLWLSSVLRLIINKRRGREGKVTLETFENKSKNCLVELLWDGNFSRREMLLWTKHLLEVIWHGEFEKIEDNPLWTI